MKNNHNVVAIILCVIFAASIMGIYAYERKHENYMMEVYARVIPEQEKQRREEEERKAEFEALRVRVRENYIAAVDKYLPGIAFCGDGLMSDTGGGGMDFRSTVNSLVRSNVCNSPTVYINVVTTPTVGDKYSGYLPVIFVGEETSLGDTDALLALQARYIGSHDRYIIVGPTWGARSDMEYLESVLAGAYGDHFINVREYMSTDGLASLELEITQEDRAAMDEGRIPPSLLKSDGIHLNDNGTRLLSYLTYDRMDQLGYFNEILEAKAVYDEVEGNDD